MGLLTREGEKEIAMRIEEAREEIKEILLSYPGTVRELLNVYSGLKMSELSVSEIAPDAEDEEGPGEEEARKERIVCLLEALKQVYDRSKKAENEEEKDRCRAEMRQIAGDIRFGRKLVERIKGRMQTSVERIEKVEREIERLRQAPASSGEQGPGDAVQEDREDREGGRRPGPRNEAVLPAHRESRQRMPGSQERADKGEPEAGCQHREEVREPGLVSPRSRAGGEYRPHEGGGEVRV